MEYITYTNGIINWRGFDFIFQTTEKIDDICAHVFMSDGWYAFMGNETTINGVLQPDADTIIATLNNR